MFCFHGITQGHQDIFDDLVSPASGGRPLGRRHDTVKVCGGQSVYGLIRCQVVDGICVRRHLDAVCGLLSLDVVVLCG